MKTLTQITTALLVLTLGAAPAFSDTLVLKNGQKITGFFEGGSARVIKFRADNGETKDYDLLTVQEIYFGEQKTTTSSQSSATSTLTTPTISAATSTTAAPAPAAAAATSTTTQSSSSSTATTSRSNDSEPRLLSSTERTAKPTSSNAANSAWTIPTGSTVVIRLIDSISSEKNKVGDQFIATLDEPVMQGGVEVIPKGADVRGRIANVNEAGRVAGSAQLGLELTQIVVNGIPYSVNTSEYQEVGEGRGSQTAKRVGGGAAIGAIIGAIAGGGKGAAIGAGVGGGGATAVQVLTKGEKLNIPSETKLEFTLRSALVIAGR